MYDHTHVGAWYLGVTFGVDRTPTLVLSGGSIYERAQKSAPSRKNTSVERSETDEKVDSRKFELECGIRNQNFFD